MAMTKLENLIDAEVMADAISGKVEQKMVVTPFAKVDTTLEGKNAGDTITVPRFAYIGDAEDVAEGIECGTVQLTADTTTAKIKKAMKAVTLTDEAVLSGYGDPVGQTNNQLAKAIAAKVDADAMDALQTAQLTYDGSANKIGYGAIVDAVDVLNEEFNTNKVIFVNPAQVGTLRKDADFIAADNIAE
jgi:N4-gp56 family major capsid protein